MLANQDNKFGLVICIESSISGAHFFEHPITYHLVANHSFSLTFFVEKN